MLKTRATPTDKTRTWCLLAFGFHLCDWIMWINNRIWHKIALPFINSILFILERCIRLSGRCSLSPRSNRNYFIFSESIWLWYMYNVHFTSNYTNKHFSDRVKFVHSNPIQIEPGRREKNIKIPISIRFLTVTVHILDIIKC